MQLREWVTNFNDLKNVIDNIEREVKKLESNKREMKAYINYLEGELEDAGVSFSEEDFD